MSQNSNTTPPADARHTPGFLLTPVDYDDAMTRRKEWVRKGRTVIDPAALELIERYQTAARQIGRKPTESDVINYIICKYSIQLIADIEMIEQIAERHQTNRL